MAKRKTKSKSSGARTVVVRERASAPVIIRAPRAAPVKHHKRRRHHGGGGGGKFGSATGAMTPTKSGSLALGRFIFWFIGENIPQIPTLPVIGKNGAIA